MSLSVIDRTPIQGMFISQDGIFQYNPDPDDSSTFRNFIDHCERGLIAWIKHLFRMNVYLDTSEGRVYVPLNEARRIIIDGYGSDPTEQGERIGVVFARVLHAKVDQIPLVGRGAAATASVAKIIQPYITTTDSEILSKYKEDMNALVEEFNETQKLTSVTLPQINTCIIPSQITDEEQLYLQIRTLSSLLDGDAPRDNDHQITDPEVKKLNLFVNAMCAKYFPRGSFKSEETYLTALQHELRKAADLGCMWATLQLRQIREST